MCVGTMHGTGGEGESRPLMVLLNKVEPQSYLDITLEYLRELSACGRSFCNRVKGVIGILIKQLGCEPATRYSRTQFKAASILANMAIHSNACNNSIGHSLAHFVKLAQLSNLKSTRTYATACCAIALLASTLRVRISASYIRARERERERERERCNESVSPVSS